MREYGGILSHAFEFELDFDGNSYIVSANYPQTFA
jgi:hypothetical protein